MLEPPNHLTPTEKAIFYVAQYPCEHCVLPKLSTNAQVNSFRNWQTAQAYIARCWLARVRGSDDPTYSEMKAKAISRDIYDWVLLKVSCFETLWVLCQLLAPQVAEALPELGKSATALSLFRTTVMDSTNWQVELSCDRVQVPGRKVDAALKLQAKSIKQGLDHKETLRLQRLLALPCRRKFSFGLLISAMARISLSKAVTAQFELFMLAAANLYEKEATMARKAEGWGWDNGVKLTGTKDGIYVPVLSES